MKYPMRWMLRSSLVLTASSWGCGSLPDWSDVQRQLAAAGSTSSAGGADSGGDTSAGGTLSNGGSAPLAGAAGAATSAGSGGETSVGGAGGGGGMTAQGGAGGASMTQDEIDKLELTDALSKLNGFVYMNPCKFSNNGSDVTTLNGCNTSDICWATQDLGQFAEHKSIPIGGSAGHLYQIDINVLGVVEPRDYPPPPNCIRMPGQPAETAGMSECTDGYANKGAVQFNIWELNVPSPAKKYYLNSVPTHPPHRVDIVDNRFTFQVNAGGTITFTMDDLNGGEIRNCSNKITTSKYMTAAGAAITASTSVQQPYNGNWFQLTVIDAKVVH